MMDAHPEEHQDLRLKIKWLMALRVSVVTLLLGVSIFLQIGFGREGKTNELFYYLIAGTYFLTLLYSFLLTRLARVVQLAKFQIGIDLLFITGLVYLTGGVESPFAVFFMVSTISGSMLLGKRGGWNAAFASAVLLAGLVYIQHYSPTTILSAKTSSSKEAFYLLFLDFLALLAVAYLSGSLAQKLSVVQGRLDEKTTGFAELKAFHECVVQSMSSGLLTTGLGGEITSFNRTAEEITGLRFYDVQGKPWWEVLGAEDLKHLFEADQPIKEPVRFDRTFFRNDGNRLLLGLTVSPLKNEEGIQIGSVWTFQNLTRIREMEEEIENKKRLATIGEMAAGMAHEIRNPLAALSGS
ncbi:MAG TPA: PAS domain S-box protein, partial [Nitrospiria bacterium]